MSGFNNITTMCIARNEAHILSKNPRGGSNNIGNKCRWIIIVRLRHASCGMIYVYILVIDVPINPITNL